MSTISAGLTLESDVTARLRMQTDSEASAQNSLAMIQAGLKGAADAAKTMGLAKAAASLRVEQDKAALKLAATFTEAELLTVLKLVGVNP